MAVPKVCRYLPLPSPLVFYGRAERLNFQHTGETLSRIYYDPLRKFFS